MPTKTFDESKIRRNTDGTFADKDKHHAPNELPSISAHDQPVGDRFTQSMYGIAEELFDHKQDWDDLPVGGCYRLNEWGDYVTEDEWDRTWQDHDLERKAWMGVTNEWFDPEDLPNMTPREIEAAYDDDDLSPDVSFCTEKYEDDMEDAKRANYWGLPDARAHSEHADQSAREANRIYADMDMAQVIEHKHRNGSDDGTTSDSARNRLMAETMPTDDKDAIGALSVAMDYSPQYESLRNLNTMMPDSTVDYYPQLWHANTDALVKQAASGHGVNRENTRRMIAVLNQVADHCRNDDNQASLAMAQIAVGHLALGERHRAAREAREALDYVDKRSDMYTAKTRHIVQAILDNTTNLD